MKPVQSINAAMGVLCLMAVSASMAIASSPDAMWLTTAASANMCEIKAGQLAQNRASDAQWKTFGGQMIADHSTALAAIQSLAAKEGVAIPNHMAPADAAQVSKLSQLRGASFDKAYMAFAVASHTQANSLYSKEIADGQDSEVRDLASKQLPVVQNHLTMVDKMTGMSIENMAAPATKTASGSM